MKAKELLDAGQLSAALEQLNDEVRAHPADAQLRTFLFEVLCFTGDHPRAAKQLDVIGHQSAAAEVGVQIYREVLEAEAARRRLFVDGVPPTFLLEPPAYAGLHLKAVDRLRANQPAEAKSLLDEAERARPRLRGRVDGKPFSDLRDVDDSIGPFLEVIVRNRYIWLPFEQVLRLRISQPKRLRDLAWIQGYVESKEGVLRGEVFLPVLYPGTSDHESDSVRLGRMTDWKPVGEGLTLGVGQRLFLVDGEERAMLEAREIEFEKGEKGETGEVSQ